MRPVPRALLATCLILLAVLPGTARAQDVAEWFPTPDSRPLGGGLAIDATGAPWYGLGAVSAETSAPIGKLDPATGHTTTFPTATVANEACCPAQVRDVSVDRVNGRVWYTKSSGVVGVAGTDGFSANNGVKVASGNGIIDLGDIVATGDGAWFAQNGSRNDAGGWTGNRMTFASPSLSLDERALLSDYGPSRDTSRYDAQPKGVTIAPNGDVWFTESNPGLPGYRIAKVTGLGYAEHPLLPPGNTTGTGPTSIAAAPDGTLWFTNRLKQTIGRYDPATDAMAEYPMSAFGLAGGDPWAVRTAPDGAIWLVVRAAFQGPQNAAVRIVPQTVAATDPTATVTKLGSDKYPLSLGIAADGTVWVGASHYGGSGNWVGRLAGTAGTAPPAGGEQPPAGGGGGTPATPIALPGATTPPVVVKPSATGTSKVQDPKVRADSVSINQICVGPPEDKCSLVYLLDAHEYVKGFPGTASAAKKRKTRRVVVGKKTVTLSGGEKKRVTITLNKAGKRILKRDGKLNARLVVQEKRGSTLKTVKTKKLRFKKKR